MIAPYEFTMEKLLFVVRSLRERLVINLESLLLHGNSDFREQILDREEKRERKKVSKKYGTKKKSGFGVDPFTLFYYIRLAKRMFFSVIEKLIFGNQKSFEQSKTSWKKLIQEEGKIPEDELFETLHLNYPLRKKEMEGIVKELRERPWPTFKEAERASVA